MNQFNSNQSIGQIVAMFPKAGEIFMEYRIDFCCGGHRPLLDAIKAQNIEETELLDKLETAYLDITKQSDQIDYNSIKSDALIDYIIHKHHGYLNRSLPEISELSHTILRVHGANHKELFDLHKLFHSLKSELELHLIKEETLLFPYIKDYEQNPSPELLKKIADTLEELEGEHDGAGDILKELRSLTKDYTLPADVCRTYELTYEKIQELEADLFQHIHLENNILFLRYHSSVLV